MPLINFAGIASGIDSSALIKALLDQSRNARILPLQKQVEEYEEQNTALGELKTLLSTLKTKAEKFRVLNGGSLSKLAGSSNESVATAVASNAATPGTYSLTVTQLAKNATFSFADRFASSSGVINSSINNGASAADRTVSVTIGSGATQEIVDVELTNTSTASEFVDVFNQSSNNSEASLVNVGTSAAPSYAIVISSKKTGLAEGQISFSVGNEIETAGSGAFIEGSATLDQAQNAEFTLSGISGTIERASNTFSDVIPGLSLNLQATGAVKITVGVDSDDTKSKLRDFVEAYNEIVNFISENDLVEPTEENGELVNIFGSLASTSIDDNILSALRSSLTSAGITGSSVNIFADLGVTTQRDGTLLFNEATFDDAIQKDPDGAKQILERLGENLAATGGTIDQFARFGGIIDSSVNSSTSQVSNLQSRIADLEQELAQQEESLRARFARLESLIGGLSSQQNALSGILASL